MNRHTPKLKSLLSRLAGCGLAAVALLGGPLPAEALRSPSSGYWEFNLYEDTGCTGDYLTTVWSDGLKTVNAPDLGAVGWSDKASSWSFCNGSTKTAAVGVKLYSGTDYGGTEISYSSITVPSGQCILKNSISSDNAVSSFKLTVILY